MTRKIFLSVTAFSLILLSNNWTHATTVERLGLEDLVKKARSIVVGKVSGSRTYWSSDRRIILTDYTIEIDESIKGPSLAGGQPSRSIAVTTIGGKIGDTELRVSGMPEFEKGENAVVFVEQSGAYQTVVGLGQGKFSIQNGEVINSMGGLAFPDGHPGNPLKMPLQNFKNQIRTLLNR